MSQKAEISSTNFNSDYLQREIEGSDRIAQMIAEKYKKKSSLKYMYSRQSDFILEFLKNYKVDQLLDLGCGIGNFLVKAQIIYPNVYGVDPAPESLKKAKQILPNVDLRLGQGENLPFDDETIDTVVMKGVVHHLKDPVVVFKEVFRCLKTSGILVIFEGNRSSLYRQMVLGFADLLKYQHESTLFAHRSPKAMKQMLAEARMEPFYCRNISGFFAPLALLGIGRVRIWKFFDRIENLFQGTCPFLFNYYVLLSARKPK